MRYTCSLVRMMVLVSVLLTVGPGTTAIGRMVVPVSAQKVGGGAPPRDNATAPSSVRSYMLTATEEIWLANGYPGLRMDTAPVRIQTTLWYDSPARWRIENYYRTPPAQRALMGAFLPNPNVSVRNGRVYWTYDSSHHTATRQTLSPGTNVYLIAPPPLFEAGALRNPVPTSAFAGAGGLRTFLKSISVCDTARLVPSSTPKLVGRGMVAGHAAYIIDFGDKPCGWNSASASEAMGRRFLWVDQHTFFMLKLVRYSVFFQRNGLFERTTVTGLHYNVPLAPSRFVFTPPPHTHLAPAEPPQVASATAKPLSEIRRQVSFPVFVPVQGPNGPRLQQATLDGADHVSIDYHAGSKHLNIGEGPLGCCLDADPRKYDGATRLPNGRTAYLLNVGAHFGGLILWWDQEGTYIALSSADLNESHLVRMAGSMSATAAAVQ